MPASHFVWYELLTPDVAGAAAFYSGVVGWQAQDSGMPGVDYTLLQVGAARTAGLTTLPAELAATGLSPGWRGYIAVDDVDASEARLRQLGGQVLRPAADIPGIGRFACVTDPQGAAFVLFKPRPTEPPPLAPEEAPGTTGWTELRAPEGGAAIDFYAALFGWTRGEALDMGHLGTYQLFDIDGIPSGGIMTRDPGWPQTGWHFYFRVDSIHAAAQRVARLGGTVTVPPDQVPGDTWVLHGRDPQGASFALLSMRK